MSLVLIAFSSFVIALSGALVPGPLLTITVSESLKKGFRAGPLIILGHGILELAIVLLLFFGITPLLTAERTKAFISLTGGLILIIMGIMLLKDARKARLVFKAEEGRKGMNLVLTGIVGSISNPYWIIWWMTIGFGYLVSSMRSGVAGAAAFYIGHIAADLAWYSMVSGAVAKGRHAMGEAGYRYMLYACGVFLLFFGGWFILNIVY
ncbi:MAG: LysE family transporter [Thermodesulfovibrionales bacterium]